MDVELLLMGTTGVLFIIFLLWELYLPARVYTKASKVNSYFTNAGVFIFNNVVTYGLSISLVFVAVSSLSIHGLFGVLPLWAQYVVGIVLLDFFIWFWHMINHKVPLLWSFHQTHHSERYLNASSAVRFHVGELLLSVLFKSLILIITGIPLVVFLTYEALITIFAIYHHANIKLSPKIQSILEFVIISPRLHQTHHSEVREEHDSNYGVIFSWWDIIFKTKNKTNPERIGLSYEEEKNLRGFLAMPFIRKG